MDSQTLQPMSNFRALIEKTIEIDAPPQAIFDSILEDMTDIRDQNDKPMGFKVEPFPGGRWYRDLGNNAGHLWGHIQVIKPPTVIEIYGPLMISSAAISHVSYRVSAEGQKQRLTIKHRLFGEFDEKIPANVGGGWQMAIERIAAKALKKSK